MVAHVNADGRVAVVSGAGRGIGSAVCRRLAASCRAIAVLDLDLEPTEEVAAELASLGVDAQTHAVDVTDAESVAQAIGQVRDAFGRIDIVVPAAGNMLGAPIEQMTPAQWSSVITTHLTGAYTLVRASAGALRSADDGRIVLVSSIAARGIANHANYGAAKAGTEGLTRSLAWELGPDGVNVNAVAPGFIDTRLTRDAAKRKGIDWADAVKAGSALAALGRIGTPEDVAAAVSFLVGPDSRFITGQVLTVSGAP